MFGFKSSGASEALIVIGIVVAALVVLFIFTFATGCAPRWVLSWESYFVRLWKQKKRWNWTMIEPGLFLGTLPRFPCHLDELKAQGVGSVLSLNEHWELGLSPTCVQDCKMNVRHLPTPDFFAPSKRDIIEAVTFIRSNIKHGSSVYVHCNGGKGRSAVCVICYLIYERDWSPDEAFQYVKDKRKIASLKAWGGLHKQWRAVKAFWCDLKSTRPQAYEVWGDVPDASTPNCRGNSKQQRSCKVLPLEQPAPPATPALPDPQVLPLDSPHEEPNP
jgi:atypical dual specificity phosphatase